MTLTSIALVLFLIMDPFGNITSFLSQLKRYDRKRRVIVTFREMGFVLLLMILFNYIGEVLFYVLALSEVTVRLASGLILFLTALEILFPSFNTMRQNLPDEEPFLIPLAVPLTAGPALLATIMLYAHLEQSQPLMLMGIFIAWLVALVVLVFAEHISQLIGKSGLGATEKLMGMILVLIAIQRFMEGVKLFVENI